MSLENDAHTKTIRYRVKLESGSLNELEMTYKELCEITKKAVSTMAKIKELSEMSIILVPVTNQE